MFARCTVLACAVALASSASLAQQAETPPESAPAKPPCVKRHDHGAERQSPSFSKDCKAAPANVAKADKKKEPQIQGHDHGKVHKNQ